MRKFLSMSIMEMEMLPRKIQAGYFLEMLKESFAGFR
jgi:hypothetical protein